MPKFLKSLDMFGAPVPMLNLRGETKVKTSIGAIVSILIFAIVFVFALFKMQQLLVKHNPQILQINDDDALDNSSSWSTSEKDFAMAFAVEHFSSGYKNDAQYFKWLVAHYVQVDGVFTIMYHETHPCTEDDYEKFYEIDRRSQQKFQTLRDSNYFQCLDWAALDLDIKGSFLLDNTYSAIELLLVPCTTRVTTVDGITIGGDDTCEWDRNLARNYMGHAFSMAILHN